MCVREREMVRERKRGSGKRINGNKGEEKEIYTVNRNKTKIKQEEKKSNHLGIDS